MAALVAAGAVREGAACSLTADVACDAAYHASVAILRVSNDSSELRYFRRDFERFAYLARLEKWTDETPVRRDCVGKLWPAGRTPDWAKAEADVLS